MGECDFTQSAITCSKLTVKTVEQSVKYVQSQQQRYANDVVLLSLLLTLNVFHSVF